MQPLWFSNTNLLIHPICFAACRPCWGLCCEWLALWESTYGAIWTRAASSSTRKPRVSAVYLRLSTVWWNLTTRNKAVSDGAVSLYLDHRVRSRISNVYYGVETGSAYIASDSEHRETYQRRQYRDGAGTTTPPTRPRTTLVLSLFFFSSLLFLFLSRTYSRWGLGLILYSTVVYTTFMIPGNTHAFREAHSNSHLG